MGLSWVAVSGKGFVSNFLLGGRFEDIQQDLVNLISGLIQGGLCILLEYRGIPVLDKASVKQIIVTGQDGVVPGLSSRYYTPCGLNPAVVYKIMGISYVEERMQPHINRYRFGFVNDITLAENRTPAITKWAKKL